MISRIMLSPYLSTNIDKREEFYMIFMIKQNEFSYDDIKIHRKCIFREIKALILLWKFKNTLDWRPF